MAQLVTLGETMAACSVLHPVFCCVVGWHCGLLFRPWLRVILPEQSVPMPFCFVCCVNHFHS